LARGVRLVAVREPGAARTGGTSEPGPLPVEPRRSGPRPPGAGTARGAEPVAAGAFRRSLSLPRREDVASSVAGAAHALHGRARVLRRVERGGTPARPGPHVAAHSVRAP